MRFVKYAGLGIGVLNAYIGSAFIQIPELHNIGWAIFSIGLGGVLIASIGIIVEE